MPKRDVYWMLFLNVATSCRHILPLFRMEDYGSSAVRSLTNFV